MRGCASCPLCLCQNGGPPRGGGQKVFYVYITAATQKESGKRAGECGETKKKREVQSFVRTNVIFLIFIPAEQECICPYIYYVNRFNNSGEQ